MSSVLFDTHDFVRRPVGAGMPEPQAEVLASEHARMINERLATKDDLTSLQLTLQHDLQAFRAELKNDMQMVETRTGTLRAELQSDMAAMKAELQREMTAQKADLLRWVAGMLVAQAAIVATLVKLL